MKRLSPNSGFSLVEVTLALGIAAFTLVAIFGLMPIGMTANQASSEQTIAAEIASAIATDLRVAPVATGTAAGTSSLYQIPLSTGTTVLYLKEATTASGWTGLSSSATYTNDARYRAEIVLNRLPTGGATATVGSVAVSWPARQNDLKKALGSFKASVALDRN